MGNICYIIAVWAKTPIITINYDWKIQIDQSHIFKWMWETKWGYQTDSTSLAAKPEQSVYHFRGMNTIKPDRTLKIHYIIQIRQKFKETMRTLLKLDHRCLSILAEILCRLRGCAEVGSDYWNSAACRCRSATEDHLAGGGEGGRQQLQREVGHDHPGGTAGPPAQRINYRSQSRQTRTEAEAQARASALTAAPRPYVKVFWYWVYSKRKRSLRVEIP